MIIEQTNGFARQKNKLHPNQIIELDKAVKKIAENPLLGEQKKGDLHQVRVYKFKAKTQEFLLAFTVNKNILTLLAIASHENFYRDIKRLLR